MLVQEVPVPPLLYGTAWKEERTADLVKLALAQGFRGIDTANQRRHYHEAGVGEAIRSDSAGSEPTRDDLFLQTKFTHREGQDSRLPYDPAADYPTQVRQSFESSLEHLGVDRIDSYLLHGPRTRRGWSDEDRQVWRTMEELHQEGRTRLIGVSNVSASQLSELCAFARVRPAFVQNRCYASRGWDRATRSVCEEQGVVYQGFSLLTANAAEMRDQRLTSIARAHQRTPSQVVFRFALQAGMICLTGTSSADHMREDLDVFSFELSQDEFATIEAISS